MRSMLVSEKTGDIMVISIFLCTFNESLASWCHEDSLLQFTHFWLERNIEWNQSVDHDIGQMSGSQDYACTGCSYSQKQIAFRKVNVYCACQLTVHVKCKEACKTSKHSTNVLSIVTTLTRNHLTGLAYTPSADFWSCDMQLDSQWLSHCLWLTECWLYNEN